VQELAGLREMSALGADDAVGGTVSVSFALAAVAVAAVSTAAGPASAGMTDPLEDAGG
jgi:hypothetical protein